MSRILIEVDGADAIEVLAQLNELAENIREVKELLEDMTRLEMLLKEKNAEGVC